MGTIEAKRVQTDEHSSETLNPKPETQNTAGRPEHDGERDHGGAHHADELRSRQPADGAGALKRCAAWGRRGHFMRIARRRLCARRGHIENFSSDESACGLGCTAASALAHLHLCQNHITTIFTRVPDGGAHGARTGRER